MLARRGETATVLLLVARETYRNQIYVLVPLRVGIVPAVCELRVLAELIAVMHKIVRADLSSLPAIPTFRLLFSDPLRKLPPLLVTVKLLGVSGSYKFSYLVCGVHNLCKYKRPLHYTTTFCISIQGSIFAAYQGRPRRFGWYVNRDSNPELAGYKPDALTIGAIDA